MTLLYAHIFVPWLILSCYLRLLVVVDSHVSNVKCFDSERNALLRFKDGIAYESGGLLASWGDDSDCCKWHGVHCRNVTGHVITLHLQSSPGTYLEGNLSRSLIELKYLRHLNLNFNMFPQPIPSFLGSLANLEYLSLREDFFWSADDSNSRHEQKLDWLLRLNSLRYLDLSSFDFSKVENWIQIVSQLPSLGVLLMDDCALAVNNRTSLTYTNSSSELRTVSLSMNLFNDSSIFRWLFNLSAASELVYLDLSQNSLDGPIPNGVGNLQHLTYLDLSTNLFTGLIPNGFDSLKRLVHLDLSSNQLEGRIPSEFNSMHSLSYISLSDNNLQGSVFKAFTRLCNLQQLYLGSNNFTDDLTNVIHALTSCEIPAILTLDLSWNRFWGVIPDSISTLSSLRVLNLAGNHLNGKISHGIGQLVMLEKLDVSSNSFETTLTQTHFLNLSRLRELYLSDNPRLVIDIDARWDPPFQLDIISFISCKLGPYFPKWLQTQTNFSSLDISYAEISDSVPVSFWSLLPYKMLYLNMSYNQIHGRIPNLPETGFSNSPQVDLGSNLFEGAIPSGFTEFSVLYLNDNRLSESSDVFCPKTETSLYEIDLSNNLLSGELPDCWTNFAQLSSLHLENNRLSGSIPKSFGTLTSLKYLHLYNNSFSGPIPSSFENCTSLSILNLGYNSLTGSIPPWIGKVQSLGALILRRNELLGEIPASLCQLPRVQILDFGLNRISGVIPRCVNNLTAMVGSQDIGLLFESDGSLDRGHQAVSFLHEATIVNWKREERTFKVSVVYVKSIDFSFNELCGEIPDGIYNLTGLIALDLSNNNLNGSIASEVGQLAALELLDLSDNHLTGRIPESLAKVSSLGILGLSNNALFGEIPLGTQLQGFSPSAYTGNPGLCGPPLSKCLGNEAPNTAPSGLSEEKGDEYGMFPGLYISVVLGIITGFWGVFGTLVIKRTWRHAWFLLLDNIHDRLYEITMIIVTQGARRP